MSFQAYITNVEIKTGRSLAELKTLADEQGFSEQGRLKPDVKAGAVIGWLKETFGLGHGHAMSIVAALKGKTA